MGGTRENSLRQRCLRAVLGGASTPAEVAAVVGRHIPAPAAIRECRRHDQSRRLTNHRGGRPRKPRVTPRSAKDAIHEGRRRMVHVVMMQLCKGGLIRRVSPGVYGPPLPKIYPAEAAPAPAEEKPTSPDNGGLSHVP